MSKRGNTASIFTRELFSYFNSPIAYIFIVVFVVLTNAMFMTQFFLVGNADMRYFFGLLPIILCVFIPAITMRLWAEERRGNTFELLLTFPMEAYKLVLGKFFAGLIFYFLTLAGTLLVPVMLFMVGKPDIGPILGGYLGSLFIGAFFLSVGIFISGLCKDQIVSFIVAMIACFFFYLTGLDFMAGLIDGWLPGVGSFLRVNFGMTLHFESFQKGVIDNRDILYFVVMTAVFLVLNVFSIEDRLRPKAKLFFSTAVGICIAISVILNSLFMDIPLGRYDLTENKLYTVTESSKNILRELKAPVLIKVYISRAESMPTALKTLEQDITDRLDELQVFSGGNLSYKIFHMETIRQQAEEGKSEDSLEDKLQQKGIAPFEVRSIEQDELGIKLIYSAIAIAYKEKEEAIIPRIIPENISNLEYELVSRIYRMTLEKTPKVALVAPYTDKQADARMQQMLRQFGQTLPDQYREDKFRYLDGIMRYENYEVSRIRLTKEEPIPEGTDTLVLVAPEELNDRQRYEINRFLAAGGNVIIAAQGFMYNYQTAGMQGVSIMPQQINHGLNGLIGNYGVRLSEKMLMDEQHDTISISGNMGFGPFEVSMPVKVPTQILINEDNINADVSITGRLSKFLYLWGSALEIEEPKIQELKLKQTVLFTSSQESWLVDFTGAPLKRTDLQKGPSGYQGPQVLGVLIEGQFPDAYKGQAAPEWPKEEGMDESVVDESVEGKAAQQELTLKPGKLLVVGCSKMFEEDIIRNGGMANLFINSVDALTLGGELIKIRGHQPISRSIKAVNNVKKLWYRFMTIFLVPVVVIAFGGIRAILRKKEKEQYLKLLSISME
ncbi:MAG TPA: Gldg family protein [Candidatus Omnitrophota bacterium]|nr:Gldg family protein [Candidatus Omnitrophota bacterium]